MILVFLFRVELSAISRFLGLYVEYNRRAIEVRSRASGKMMVSTPDAFPKKKTMLNAAESTASYTTPSHHNTYFHSPPVPPDISPDPH